MYVGVGVSFTKKFIKNMEKLYLLSTLTHAWHIARQLSSLLLDTNHHQQVRLKLKTQAELIERRLWLVLGRAGAVILCSEVSVHYLILNNISYTHNT